METKDTVEVYWASDEQDANLAKACLEEAGIKAEIVGQMLQQAIGDLPMGPSTSPRVWVAKTDEARAKEVLAEFEKRAKGEKWTCPSCGENVGGEFDLCWKCQTVRP